LIAALTFSLDRQPKDLGIKAPPPLTSRRPGSQTRGQRRIVNTYGCAIAIPPERF
jgi:hypothetical protein